MLEETLHGAIKALMELLALTWPVASGRALRLSRYASVLATELKIPRWDVEVAAMLSQVGCVTVSPELAERICRGATLTLQEHEIAARMPLIAKKILSAIPRLDAVRAIIRSQHQDWRSADSNAVPPIGSRILRVVADFDVYDSQRISVPEAIGRIGANPAYDPTVVGALRAAAPFLGTAVETFEMSLNEVEDGMILASDVHNPLGVLLIARGQEITSGIEEQIRNHWVGLPITYVST